MNNIFIFLHLKEIHFSDISLSPDEKFFISNIKKLA